MNVLIVCAAGMSSSALAQRFRDEIRKEGLNIKVGTCGVSQYRQHLSQADLVFIAPQISWVQKELNEKKLMCLVIDEKAYGEMNADVLMDMALHPDDYIPKEKKEPWYKGIAVRFAQRRSVIAITDGFSSLMPVSLVGSILSLCNTLPIPYLNTLISSGIVGEYLSIGINMTMGMLSLYLSIFIAMSYSEQTGISKEGLVLSCMVDFIAISGISPLEALQTGFFDGRGMLCATAITLVTCHLYGWTESMIGTKKSGYITSNIIDSFYSLIPVSICMFLTVTVSTVFYSCFHVQIAQYINDSIVDAIGRFAGNSASTLLGLKVLATLFWFVGIHGGKLTGTVSNPIFQPLSVADVRAWTKGETLPYLINSQTSYMFTFGGIGSTLSLTFLMLVMSKSRKMKQLGKISFPMGIFFINEPLIFGLPFVLNLYLLIPFTLIPLISGVMTIIATRVGFLPACIGFEIPWTTPPLISGLIQGGWKLALWQAFMLVLQAAMWYPVFHHLDQEALKEEKSA